MKMKPAVCSLAQVLATAAPNTRRQTGTAAAANTRLLLLLLVCPIPASRALLAWPLPERQVQSSCSGSGSRWPPHPPTSRGRRRVKATAAAAAAAVSKAKARWSPAASCLQGCCSIGCLPRSSMQSSVRPTNVQRRRLLPAPRQQPRQRPSTTASLWRPMPCVASLLSSAAAWRS